MASFNFKKVKSRKFLVIAGPSGSGKSTITKILLEKHQNQFSLPRNVTTRLARPDDNENELIYLNKNEFKKLQKENKFFYMNLSRSNFYGFLCEDILRAKGICLLNFRSTGALNLKKINPEIPTIIIKSSAQQCYIRSTTNKKLKMDYEDFKIGFDQDQDLLNLIVKYPENTVFIENFFEIPPIDPKVIISVENFVKTINYG